MKKEFGRLVKVPLREGWRNEANDFTPWLAGSENLALLGETIGIDLLLDSVEKQVGSFRADILCKDSANDSWVIIENQLEKTDHNHLGQIITYAAGLEASTVIWISNRFTEEHRAALDWLNEVTTERAQFFGVEVELWQIGDSAVAPKFNIVCKPNQWSRVVTGGGGISEGQAFNLEFWDAYFAYSRVFSDNRTPSKDHWKDFGVGRTGFRISLVISRKLGNSARVELTCMDLSKRYFKALLNYRSMVEEQLGISLKWIESEGIKSSRVNLELPDISFDNRKNWPYVFDFFDEWYLKFDRVFRPIIQGLPDLDDYEEYDDA